MMQSNWRSTLIAKAKQDFEQLMKIAVASEHRGFKLKAGILSGLNDLKHQAIDFGPLTDEMCDYPDYAAKAARAVSVGEVDRAILIGGTGIGMNIVANKFCGVRAALCYDDLSARMCRSHFDANVLCLPADLFGGEFAARMIELWLDTPFDGGHHAIRLAKITQYENEIQNAAKARH